MMDIVARAMASKALSKHGINQYENKDDFPKVGEEGALYVDVDNNMLYYWDNLDLIYKCLNCSAESETITKEILIEILQTEELNGGEY